jgi:hypothetical protein
MATRSSSSEFQPSPPINRLNSGKVTGRLALRLGTSVNPGVKPNMCCAPATNGERALGKVTPSSPASTTKMMKLGTSYGG